MFELIAEICLASDPASCVDRHLPGPCLAARAEQWVAERPGLVLAGFSCADNAITSLEVEEIAPGVFAHRGRHELPDPANAGDQANLGFVIGAEAVAVIDAGGSRAVGERLLAAVRAETDLPVAWLILTHSHPDHVFGASVFREAGATILGHAKLPAAMASRNASYTATLEREAGPIVAIGSEIMLPDATVDGRREIELGGRVLVLDGHPTAHTDNDLTVLDVATGTWFLGDLVFQGHTPVVDGSALGWLALLDELAAEPAARIVPGHGPVSLRWPNGAAATRDYLDTLVAETRAALEDGVGLAEAAGTVGAELRGDWVLFDVFNGRNVTAIYRELEWE